jgi:hypothetical protein
MSLPTNRGDREHQKFVKDSKGNVAVRVKQVIEDSEGDGLDIDEYGRVQAKDMPANNKLQAIYEKLDEILLQLKLITGA